MNKDTSNFFINVSNGRFWFVNFTSNRIWRFQMTIFINTSYWVITFRYNFISLAISGLDDIWFFTFFSCIIWCVIWWFRCILTRFLDFVTFRIYISDNNFTFFWCFFHFIDIGYIFIFFSNWTFNWIWSCKVTIWVNLTNSICTCWYQLVSFTVVLNCTWTIIYNCIIFFINRLFIFICYWSFNSCSFSIFIVNINTSLFIWLNKVIIYISWRLNRSWNWVVITKRNKTLEFRIDFSIWRCWIFRFCSTFFTRFCLNYRNFTSNNVVTVVTSSSWSKRCIWSTLKRLRISFITFISCFECYCLCIREPTCNNKGFASSCFINFNMVVTIFAVYICNFCLISRPLFTSFIYFTGVDECVLRYIFSTNIRCSKIVNLRWIKGIEFGYSWAISINDFRNTFHVVVVSSTLKFDQFLTNNSLTKDTWCFLSCVCCCWNLFVPLNITVSWSCELLTCKTCLRIACKDCFISSWCVCLIFCVLATVNNFIVGCLISFRIRNRSLNVWFIFIFVTWVVGITNLKCFVLKVSVNQWEGYVTWICSVSTCISQSICYIRVIVCDVARKRNVAFTSMNSTCVCFCPIRFLHNTQVYIWGSWEATSDGWTIYCKSSVVVVISLIARILICFKELPYTKCIAISVWIQSITRFIESCIFNRCTIRIWNNWGCSYTTSSACWDWSQLCWNCWSTVYCCVSSKSCCSQCCHHVIYWLAQTFALVCVWLSWSISVDQVVACCQFCLNFSDGSFNCCFLFWCWNSCWVVACDLVQQFCFWSVLF